MALDCLGGGDSKCFGGPIQCIIIMVCLLYIISPIDLLPDFIPIFGWIDDAMAGLMLLGTVFLGSGKDIFGKMGNVFK
jgi:hypothetical protein